MNRRQQIVQKQFIHNEEAVINRLKQVYGQSLKDVTAKAQKLDDEIKELTDIYNDVEDEAEKAVLKSRIQSKVYQKKYQDGLKKQVSDILDKMHDEEFKTVSDYLTKCYDEAFVGTLYDLQGQGIPLAFPIDQEAVTRAVQIDSKISQGLYERLGEDVDVLKKKIVAQVSRGISTGASFKMVAKQLASYTNIGYNNAVRIARTEGHRIQCQSTMDACHNAKDRGADVVKQWDSTLDAKTRDSHVKVDGEYKELGEKFSNGLMFPGDPNGGAAEVVNCRCALLQRASWALKEKINPETGEVSWEDGSFTKMNNFTKQLETFDSPEAYADFKKGFFSKENKQYMNYIEKMQEKYGTRDFATILSSMNEREYKHYSELLAKNPMFNKQPLTESVKDDIISVPKKSADDSYNAILETLQKNSVEYNPVKAHPTPLADADIIEALAGGDMTSGSCASVGLAYIGQRQGWDVLDFRDGKSREVYSRTFNLHTLSQMKGLKTLKAQGASSLTVGNRLLKQCEVGKEYYLCVGRHAAIVRKTPEGTLQYLELQSKDRSGWTDFDKNARHTLNHRFGCSSRSDGSAYWDFMIDIDESDFAASDDFKSLLGYINTDAKKQRKGIYGTIK